jgi:hypothetical protein
MLLLQKCNKNPRKPCAALTSIIEKSVNASVVFTFRNVLATNSLARRLKSSRLPVSTVSLISPCQIKMVNAVFSFFAGGGLRAPGLVRFHFKSSSSFFPLRLVQGPWGRQDGKDCLVGHVPSDNGTARTQQWRQWRRPRLSCTCPSGDIGSYHHHRRTEGFCPPVPL